MAKDDSQKRHLPINLLLGAVVLATIVTGLLQWLTFKSADDLLALQLRNQKIIELQGIVTHYDEVLTMSARMAAVTGRAKWETRYREFEPLLDKTLKEVISLQQKEIKLADDTYVANLKLVEMEEKALVLVQQKRLAEASKVLFSAEYEKQKKIYSDSILDFNKNINDSFSRALEAHGDRLGFLKSFLFLFLTISFFGWIFVFIKVRRWNKDLGVINEHLDLKVKEKTAVLLNTSNMCAFGEMAGGVAHEINNPLAVIVMRIEQMEDCIKDGAIDKVYLLDAITVIKNTVNRISKIVSGLQYFAREGQSAESQTVLISKLIEETLNFCTERLRNHGVRLDVVKNRSYHAAQIECRAVEISQVLLNLLNNAFDAVEDLKEKWVRIETLENEQFVEISITDSGRGIPKDIQDKMMRPFFTTKEIGKGTGLGLSTSSGIVVAHKGKICVDDTCPNTKFTIVIPKTQSNF